jgi:hypothetical protein
MVMMYDEEVEEEEEEEEETGCWDWGGAVRGIDWSSRCGLSSQEKEEDKTSGRHAATCDRPRGSIRASPASLSARAMLRPAVLAQPCEARGQTRMSQG